ncbi:MAG: hypothetical protein ABL928_01155 [Sphingorhabdus sp.]
MSENVIHSNANSHVNCIADVTLDEAGFIHTAYGSYHPVTGEGLVFDIPETLKIEILRALIQDSIDSGPAVEFDWDAFMAERFGS